MSTVKANTSRSGRAGRAFTLAELLVALGIIMLSMTVMLPVLRGLFVASGDIEAIASMGGMLSEARGLAIETQAPSLLHVQPGVDNSGWAAAMKLDTGLAVPKFVSAPGFVPQKIPGGYIFGQVTAPYVSGNDFQAAALDTDLEVMDFLTFNVIFSAEGALITQVNGAAPVIDTAGAAFSSALAKVKIWDASRVWDGAPAKDALKEDGIKVMVPVPYMQFKLTDTNRYTLVNDEKRFLVINPYTGQLLSEE